MQSLKKSLVVFPTFEWQTVNSALDDVPSTCVVFRSPFVMAIAGFLYRCVVSFLLRHFCTFTANRVRVDRSGYLWRKSTVNPAIMIKLVVWCVLYMAEQDALENDTYMAWHSARRNQLDLLCSTSTAKKGISWKFMKEMRIYSSFLIRLSIT